MYYGRILQLRKLSVTHIIIIPLKEQNTTTNQALATPIFDWFISHKA